MVSIYTDYFTLHSFKLKIPYWTHIDHLWGQETWDLRKILTDRAAQTIGRMLG